MIIVLIVMWLLSAASVVKTEILDDEFEMSLSREIFLWENTELYFYSEKVSWEESNAICESEAMHLVVIDNLMKAKFVAKSLSEAWMKYEDMWIDAQKIDGKNWFWTSLHKPLHSKDSAGSSNESGNNFPPWINDITPARPGIDCAVINRNAKNNPFFVDMSCKHMNSFICEKYHVTRQSQIKSLGVVNIDDAEYILYDGRLTWPEAVNFCRQQGFTLGTVQNISVVKKLANAMMKSRPEMEEAWIGSYYQENRWVWIENGEEVPFSPIDYENQKMRNGKPRMDMFPMPWLNNSKQLDYGKKCILLDSHLCDNPQLIAMGCDRKRDFICLNSDKPYQERKSMTRSEDYSERRYTLFIGGANWEEAKEACENLSSQASLLILKNMAEAKFVMTIMMKTEPPTAHLWIGGRIINDQWHWVHRNENDNALLIPEEVNESGFPPWCDNSVNDELACLNLDRHGQNTPVIYGLECFASQSFICVEPISNKNNVRRSNGKPQSVNNGKLEKEQEDYSTLIISKLGNVSVSWNEAKQACEKEIGKLWKPKFDSESLKIFLGSLIKTSGGAKIYYFVNGGVYRAKINAWSIADATVQIKTAEKPQDGDCMVLKLEKFQHEWLPVKCDKKLKAQVPNYSYIAQLK